MISYLGFVVNVELRREPHRTGIIGYDHQYKREVEAAERAVEFLVLLLYLAGMAEEAWNGSANFGQKGHSRFASL